MDQDMAGHAVNKTGYREGTVTNHGRAAASLVATLEVVPPIEVGPGLVDAVLGRNPEDITLRHVHTSEALTAFVIEAAHRDGRTATPEIMISLAAERLLMLVNGQIPASELATGSPFSDVTEQWARLRFTGPGQP